MREMAKGLMIVADIAALSGCVRSFSMTSVQPPATISSSINDYAGVENMPKPDIGSCGSCSGNEGEFLRAERGLSPRHDVDNTRREGRSGSEESVQRIVLGW